MLSEKKVMENNLYLHITIWNDNKHIISVQSNYETWHPLSHNLMVFILSKKAFVSDKITNILDLNINKILYYIMPLLFSH